jgi:hypothetical protein
LVVLPSDVLGRFRCLGTNRSPGAAPGFIEKAMPRPTPMSDWQADREYNGWTLGIADVPVERFFGPAEKINITVPGRSLKQIDEHARGHGETRSGFLTKAALEAMRRA